MKLSGYIFFICLLLPVISCSPIRYLGIETYNPSGITFPQEVKRVLIVNNAVAQPNVPYESTIRSQQDTVRIPADSTVYDFCRTLGEEIAVSPYFDDVRLLEEPYRSDPYFFTDRMLTTDDVRLLCREHEVDAVISLDQLLFQIRESLQRTAFEAESLLEIDVSGVVRAYLPDRNSPLTTIMITDTIYPQTGYTFPDIMVVVDPEIMLRETAKYVAEKSIINFVPHWSNDVRWYFISSNAQWKEAAAYAVQDRWDKAFEKWKSIYEQTPESSWQSRSRLASNMALSNELTGDFANALYWANISMRLLQDNLKDGDKAVQLQKLYVGVLENRMLSEKKLQLQISE